MQISTEESFLLRIHGDDDVENRQGVISEGPYMRENCPIIGYLQEHVSKQHIYIPT